MKTIYKKLCFKVRIKLRKKSEKNWSFRKKFICFQIFHIYKFHKNKNYLIIFLNFKPQALNLRSMKSFVSASSLKSFSKKINFFFHTSKSFQKTV